MIIYLFTAIGFPPGGSGRKLLQKQERGSYIQKEKKIHKAIQKHRIHKIENKHTKQ